MREKKSGGGVEEDEGGASVFRRVCSFSAERLPLSTLVGAAASVLSLLRQERNTLLLCNETK